jgi:hypothetical protein
MFAVRLRSRVENGMIARGGDVGEALLAILMAPGTMAILLGLEMLERRLLGSRTADNGRGPDS